MKKTATKRNKLSGRARFAFFSQMAGVDKDGKKRKAIFWRGYLASGLFFSVICLQALAGLFLEKLLAPERRKKMWRVAARYDLAFFFALIGLKIVTEGRQSNLHPDSPAIYTANHLSGIDGLILFYLLGPSVSVMTAPADSFGFPFSFWFRKMEFVDVARSDVEVENFSDAHTPHEAVLAAANEIKEGNHLIIFPEGHIEVDRKIIYFHTGAARIALFTGARVVPVGIVDNDCLTDENKIVKSGKLKIVVGNMLDLSDYCKRNLANVKKASGRLQDEIIKLLPERYYPLGWKKKNQEQVAAIFNLNGTVLDGDAQLEFIKRITLSRSLLQYSYIKFLVLSYFKLAGRVSDDYYSKAFDKMFENYRADDFYMSAKSIFNKHLKFMVYEKIKVIIKDHKEKKHKIILVSSSPAPLVKCFADYLGADYWLGSVMEEKNVCFTGKPLFLVRGNRKKDFLKKIEKTAGIKLSESYAYGHDTDDEPVMTAVKYRTYINPSGLAPDLHFQKNASIIET